MARKCPEHLPLTFANFKKEEAVKALLDDSKELQRFKAVSAKSKEDLVSQGFTEFTIEDFYNTFMDLIEQVEKQTSVADLLASFNDQSTSDYLVIYLRLLTLGYLQWESKFFEHFIEGGRTVKEFCQQEVEPMCKESDHIHIIALAQALSVSIQVEYMDRGEGGTINPHIFPEGSVSKVYLLYRPGHYNILYKYGRLACCAMPASLYQDQTKSKKCRNATVPHKYMKQFLFHKQ
ncbi:hypothetical protein U0070_012751 [Myodes glareolus]|uniref:ubiquitinyl hydrolase 1 n=1 Tax=Myodes glareolus TaxID=447135 RepID=A0AAW0H7V0_MYOGA